MTRSSKSASLFTPTLRPLPAELVRNRLSLKPNKSFWRTAATISLFALTTLMGVIYEFFLNDICVKTDKFEEYRISHGAVPPHSELYYRDMTWETLVCYACLVIGTYTLFLALRLVWRRIVIDISQTKDFES